jgi:hypothetical protein
VAGGICGCPHLFHEGEIVEETLHKYVNERLNTIQDRFDAERHDFGEVIMQVYELGRVVGAMAVYESAVGIYGG